MDGKMAHADGAMSGDGGARHARERDFHFLSGADQGFDPPAAAERRDWGAAIDLVKEACEAIRFAEERAQAAQDYAKQLVSHHKEQLKAADARTAAAERRAEQALQRAVDAESWLARLHDAIVEGFTRREKA